MSAPFAQISQGPLNPTGLNTNPQALILDRQNNIVSSVGDSGMEEALEKLLSVAIEKTALTTITTAQTLFSKAMPANALNKKNRTLRVSGYLNYTSPGTTTPTITIALVLGAVTLCSITTAAISATASTSMPIWFQFDISVSATGSSGTFEAHGQLTANISANTPAAGTANYLDTNTAASSAVDLTAAQTLKTTIASSGAGISGAQLMLGEIELVN
jgi:hypothetical protein